MGKLASLRHVVDLEVLKVEALTPKDAGDLAAACFTNAQSLLRDAQVLFDSGRHSSAAAWGILAAEEYGKALLCCYAITLRGDDETSWRTFWNQWRSHPMKLELAAGRLVDVVMSGLPAEEGDDVWHQAYGQLAEHVRRINRGKQAAIYVDWQDGSVVVPFVAEYEVRLLLDQIETVLGVDHRFWGQQDLAERLARIAPLLREFVDEIRAAHLRGDRDGALSALERFLRTNSQAPGPLVDELIESLRG